MLTIAFLGLSAVSFNASALPLNTIIAYFDYGYNVGVKPLLWPVIPALARGAGLDYHQVPQNERTAAYLLGAAGVATGISALALAVYGAYKLLTKSKQVQVSTK